MSYPYTLTAVFDKNRNRFAIDSIAMNLKNEKELAA